VAVLTHEHDLAVGRDGYDLRPVGRLDQIEFAGLAVDGRRGHRALDVEDSAFGDRLALDLAPRFDRSRRQPLHGVPN
jgi:hypothetical protein